MKTRTIIEILKDARLRISQPRSWTRCTLARDSSNYPVESTSPDAVCFCAVGSIERSIYEIRKRNKKKADHNTVLTARFKLLDSIEPALSYDLIMLNDGAKSPRPVIRLLTNLIKKLEASQ